MATVISGGRVSGTTYSPNALRHGAGVGGSVTLQHAHRSPTQPIFAILVSFPPQKERVPLSLLFSISSFIKSLIFPQINSSLKMKVAAVILSFVAAAMANGGCNADNCARAVTGTREGKLAITSRQADCSSFMRATVVPDAA